MFSFPPLGFCNTCYLFSFCVGTGANNRIISSPPVAIFIHPLARNISFLQLRSFFSFLIQCRKQQRGFSVDSSVVDIFRYWNYLRKQTFVLESYNTRVNWLMNRALFYSHCWLSWSFVMPFVMSTLQLFAFLRFVIGSPYLEKSSCTTVGCLWRTYTYTCTYTYMHTYM